ncbi:unnamed protein product [Linum trigynum]|uniref:Uncharacterized protein n=1 Tax=Linum trigynum TaxID=586398 RepID=A0AAV2CPM7_9ROSI
MKEEEAHNKKLKKMAIPLVLRFPNSTTLVLAGSWNRSPGDSRMNKATATITGPQSAPPMLGIPNMPVVACFSINLAEECCLNPSSISHSLYHFQER